MTDHIHQQEYVAYLKRELDQACAIIATKDEQIRELKNKLIFYTAKFAPRNPSGGRPKQEKPVTQPDHFEDPTWLPMGRTP